MSTPPNALLWEAQQQHGIKLLFGAKILLLNSILAFISISLSSHSLVGYTLAYIAFGLMVLGMVVQLYSIRPLRRHTWPFATRLLWWICMIIYTLWNTMAGLALSGWLDRMI